MTSDLKAVFRVDSSPKIGSGHAMRCLALAGRLHAAGWSCKFVSALGSRETTPALADKRFQYDEFDFVDVNTPDGRLDFQFDGADLLVVDHYDIGRNFESHYRANVGRLLVIDDLADRSHDCDMLLDSTPGRQLSDYDGLIPTDTVVRTGSHYALLRDEFIQERLKLLLSQNWKFNQTVKIFVCFGAMDNENMSSLVLDALEHCTFDYEAHMVLGPSSHNLRGVSGRVSQLDDRIKLHIWPDGISKLMARCDLAIGAGGSLALERCCLGLPSMLSITAKNQRGQAAALRANEAVEMLGSAQDVSAYAIVETLDRLVSSPDIMAKMRDQALNLCDGLGASRILSDILPSRGRDGLPVTLRPAVFEDREKLFEWQNQQGARQYFKNAAIPTWDEHTEWFSNSMRNPRHQINIIESEGEPAGYLRLELSSAKNGLEVSILVGAEFANSGIGTGALSQARRLLPNSTFYAFVDSRNDISRRLFKRAGYKPEGAWLISRGSLTSHLTH